MASTPATAAAQSIPVGVPGTDACLDGARLAALLREHAFAASPGPGVRVDVAREPPSTVAFAVRRRGEVLTVRRFEDPPADCVALHEMLALAIVIALDGVPPAPDEPTAPTQVAAVRSRSDHPAQIDRRSPTMDADLDVSGMFGVIPGYAIGGSLSLHFMTRGWLDLRASVVGSVAPGAPLGAGTMDVALAALRLDGCFARALGRHRGRACLGAAGGRAFGASHGFPEDRSASAGWVALTGRVAILAPITRRLGIDAGFDVIVPVLRPVFTARGQDGAPDARTTVPDWGLVLSVGPALLFY